MSETVLCHRILVRQFVTQTLGSVPRDPVFVSVLFRPSFLQRKTLLPVVSVNLSLRPVDVPTVGSKSRDPESRLSD